MKHPLIQKLFSSLLRVKVREGLREIFARDPKIDLFSDGAWDSLITRAFIREHGHIDHDRKISQNCRLNIGADHFDLSFELIAGFADPSNPDELANIDTDLDNQVILMFGAPSNTTHKIVGDDMDGYNFVHCYHYEVKNFSLKQWFLNQELDVWVSVDDTCKVYYNPEGVPETVLITDSTGDCSGLLHVQCRVKVEDYLDKKHPEFRHDVMAFRETFSPDDPQEEIKEWAEIWRSSRKHGTNT